MPPAAASGDVGCSVSGQSAAGSLSIRLRLVNTCHTTEPPIIPVTKPNSAQTQNISSSGRGPVIHPAKDPKPAPSHAATVPPSADPLTNGLRMVVLRPAMTVPRNAAIPHPKTDVKYAPNAIQPHDAALTRSKPAIMSPSGSEARASHNKLKTEVQNQAKPTPASTLPSRVMVLLKDLAPATVYSGWVVNTPRYFHTAVWPVRRAMFARWAAAAAGHAGLGRGRRRLPRLRMHSTQFGRCSSSPSGLS